MPYPAELKLFRCISYYEKEIGIWMGDHEFEGIDLDFLKALVDAPDTDPDLRLGYPLNENQAEVLKELIDLEFEFRFYDFFLHSFTRAVEIRKY